MKYKEIENVLPRSLDENLKGLLENFAVLIDNAINFGTHLMKWDAEKKHAGDEDMPPLLFLRNILELGDAISILIRKSSIDSCKPLLRSLLENTFGLEYMLEKETEKRALSFIVWNTHKNIKLYEKLNSTTPSGKQFKSEIEKDRLLNGVSIFFDNPILAPAQKNAEDLLKLSKYVSIENEYKSTVAAKKNPAWYTLFGGPNNIEQLAKYLNLHAFYEILYRDFSGSVHATSVFQRKLFLNNNGTVDIVQIRYPEDAQSITQSATNILIMTYLVYLKFRLPERNEEFQEWYSEFRIQNNKLSERQYLKIEE
jgi:Family of unknown function (DUF5677)